MEIFVSWSGDRSKRVALALKSWLYFLLPAAKFWISDDIPSGAFWLQELMGKLNTLNSGILCLTPENISAPWLNFEAGALLKSIDKARLFVYLFDLDPARISNSPLQYFQARVADLASTKQLVSDINRTLETPLPDNVLSRNFDRDWGSLEEQFNLIRSETEGIRELEAVRPLFDRAVTKAAKKGLLNENRYLRRIVTESIQEYSAQISHLERDFAMPHALYPFYLVKLLKAYDGLPVKALAIVDDEELFWPQTPGKEILRHTSEKHGMRIFVFRKREQMQSHLAILKEHAKYEVRVISYDNLNKVFPYPQDFSILGDVNESCIVAYYDADDPLKKTIRFTANRDIISRHYDVFLTIRDAAIEVSRDLDIDRGAEQLLKDVFMPLSPRPSATLTALESRMVEMSSYIHIHDYDSHEEKHAYYPEMMARMIEICKGHPAAEPGRILALELGAGTGIFTKRLLRMRNIEVTALEIDWACYHVLLDNMRNLEGMQKNYEESGTDISEDGVEEHGQAALRNIFYSKELASCVKCIYADSRTHNPEGKFDYIFSSFADHHINKLDKPKYFQNIKRNLRPGGLIIVGDEFLPDYDENDTSARESALRAYHGHIISESKKIWRSAATELVKLEEAALESGLKAIGDFKVSCTTYDRLLEEAGFKFRKERIGPLDRDDIGGVYVYTLWVP